MDMLHGPLLGKLVAFALPIAASSMLQQLFNFADTAVVGHFASARALAAVGINTEIIAFCINLFVGMSVGANVLIASYIGRKEREEISGAVHTAITMALFCGAFLMLLGQIIARPILQAVNAPGDILEMAVLYLRLYFMGAPFIMLFNFGAAILRAQGDSRRPLYALICAGVINVLLNLFFVIVCRLDVAGVALATVISNILSSGAVLIFLAREDNELRFSPRKLCFDRKKAGRIVKVGVPAGITGAVFAFANVFIQAAINGFGSAAVAGASATLTLEYMAYYIHSAFNQATTTFVSQNYAAGQLRRCRKIVRRCLVSSMLGCAAFIGILYLFRMPILHFFTSDEEVIAFALTRIMSALVLEWLPAIYEIPGAALRGMGHPNLPALETVLGTCCFRLFWIAFVFRGSGSFQKLLAVFPFSWVLTGTIILTTYFIIIGRETRRIPG